MTEVIPAIIPQSFEDLKDRMSRVKGLTALVQIDIEDGKFVPSSCWPYKGDEGGDFQKILSESEGFPFWESMDFEADLMISEPEIHAEDFIKLGAKRIILHIESSPKMLDFVKELRSKYGYFGESVMSVEIGIGINIATPNSVLDAFLTPNELGRTLADFIQFMGIDVIGYQEQRFDPVVLDKIEELRIKYPDAIISVDGGVNFENAHQLVHAGVNRLVSGSTLYNSDDMKAAIEEMKNS